MHIIIKPAGVVTLAGVLALGGVFLWKRSGTASVGQPVGQIAGVDGSKRAAAIGEVTDPGELEEKDMLKGWNQEAGQARDWLFLGPLASGEAIGDKTNTVETQAQMTRIINKAYLPNEAKYTAREGASFELAGKRYSWRKIHGSAFDFKSLYASNELPMDQIVNMVVYGVTQIQSDKAQTKTVRFRSDDGAIVWLNGTQVYKATEIRGVRIEDKITFNLKQGKNTILVKVGQGHGGWGLMMHVEDVAGIQ